MQNYKTDISNVLVIGCGGAGLRAAIEVKSMGLSVKVLGKRSKLDAHTCLAAGGINASYGNLDKKDSWEQHFIDTFTEGHGLSDPETVEIMCKEATNSVKEIDNWGANFAKLSNGKFNQRYFGAHKYRRTCFSGDYTGQSILKALLNKANKMNIQINDSEYTFQLLVESNICFGAISFNKESGQITVHYADSVILCTGGHTRIWKKSTSRFQENHGDGYYLALKAGCELIDMEMVQFHPTGMLFPEELAGTLVTEAVRGEGGKLINNKGERFMEKYDKERMELSSRDKIARANFQEILEGRGTPNGGVYLDISHKSKDFIMEKIPKIFRQFIEFQMLDISKSPMEVAPTAHYSMGGISVEASNHKTAIEGLYAAGEVTGGLHGANRLGGNSLTEILVFGKIAGNNAGMRSRNLESHIRSKKVLENALSNLKDMIKGGSHLVLPLQHKLREIMWSYCGVIRNEQGLRKGIKEVQNLQILANDLDIRLEDNNFTDLVNAFDLKASLISAEATLLSALNRKESRGSHQRSDFTNTNENNNFNFSINYSSGSFSIQTKKYKIKKNLKKLIFKKSEIETLEGRLLE